MNIVLDIDGVIADFNAGYERLFKKHLTLPESGVTKDEWKKINDTDFWIDLPLTAGGKYLASLGEVPDCVYLLTSRKEKLTKSSTHVWLRRNDIAIPDARVLFANPRGEKLTYLKSLAPCRFLDDSISTVDFCGTLRDVDATLMLQPYNGSCALRYFPSMEVTNSVEEWMNV